MKSYKREVGACLLIAGLITLWWFTGIDDAEMVKAYATAMPGIILALIGAGITPFGLHHVFKRDDDG